MLPCHVCPARVRCPLTHFTALSLGYRTISYRSGMKTIPSSLLTPPAGCSFQPDLICQWRCMTPPQSSAARPDPGPLRLPSSPFNPHPTRPWSRQETASNFLKFFIVSQHFPFFHFCSVKSDRVTFFLLRPLP